MRVGSASGIAGHGDFSLICPVPDGETLPLGFVFVFFFCFFLFVFLFSSNCRSRKLVTFAFIGSTCKVNAK